jgi:hypothetical protein
VSTVAAQTYDYAIAPTLSDSDDEPIPFTGLYIGTTGNVVIWNYGGPQSANPITVPVVGGTYLLWPIKRVGLSTSATVLGLVSAIVR